MLGIVNEQLNGRPNKTELYIVQWKLKISKQELRNFEFCDCLRKRQYFLRRSEVYYLYNTFMSIFGKSLVFVT